MMMPSTTSPLLVSATTTIEQPNASIKGEKDDQATAGKTDECFEALLRSKAPLNKLFESLHILFPKPNEWSTVESQDFISTMITDLTASPFPPAEEYIVAFLNKYIKEVEKENVNSIESDALTELLHNCIRVTKSEAIHDPLFTTYQSFNHSILNGTIGFRIAPKHNDVGLRLWEAGYYLTEFFLANKHFVKGMKCVEIGAGVGLASVVVQGLCGATNTHMTDYTDDVISNMKYNIEKNERWLTEKTDGDLTCGYLDWHDVEKETDISSSSFDSIRRLANADVLFAADVAYNPVFLPQLLATVEKFLKPNKDEENCIKEKYAYFAMTMRNEKTFELLIELLKKKGIQYKTINRGGADLVEENHIFPCYHVQKREEVMIHQFFVL